MSLPLSIGRFLLVFLLLAGCTEHPDSASQPSAKALAARQELIQQLARNIQFYHKHEDGGIYSFSNAPNQKVKTYYSRPAVRTELNRMLDSLKATGPLHMGNQEDGTDTIPGPLEPGTVVTSTNTSTVTSWMEGDSAATVRTRKVHPGSTGTP